jgi:hypothetical protein
VKIYRNKKLLEIVRESPCQNCGIEDGTVVAAHSNQQRDGKGTGIKASDAMICALCYKCHANLDSGSKMTREERLELFEHAHRQTMKWLIENEYLVVDGNRTTNMLLKDMK